jgi:hypothetical protein
MIIKKLYLNFCCKSATIFFLVQYFLLLFLYEKRKIKRFKTISKNNYNLDKICSYILVTICAIITGGTLIAVKYN